MHSPNLLKEGHSHHVAGQMQDTAGSLQNRGFEDDENIFGRAYDLEARERGGFGAVGSVFSIYA